MLSVECWMLNGLYATMKRWRIDPWLYGDWQEKNLYSRSFLKKSGKRSWKTEAPAAGTGIQYWIWLPCHARWISLSRSFPNTFWGSIPPSVSGLPRYVLRQPKRWFWRSQTIVMIWFLPSAASLPAPISTVCSKRKKAVLLRLGERKTVKECIIGVHLPTKWTPIL